MLSVSQEALGQTCHKRYHGRNLAFVIALLSAVAYDCAFAAPSQGSRSDTLMGEVVIEGSCIVELAVTADTKSAMVLKRPGSTITLPRGRYRISAVTLEGNYVARDYNPANGGFEVTPEKPTKIAAGAPLTPSLTVTRRGTILELNYELRDAAGRKYSQESERQPPRFEVAQHGRKLGSGSFQYG